VPLRDVACLGLMAALLAVLFPGWDVDAERSLTDVAGQVASYHLPPALGFVLALRCGAVDLSVWAAFAVGGLVAAGALNAGLPEALAVAAGVAAGGALGAGNGLLVARARLPSAAVTLALAAGCVWAAQAAVPGRAIRTPPDAFAAWHVSVTVPFERDRPAPSSAPAPPGISAPAGGADVIYEDVWLPLSVTRMILVAGAFAVVLLALLAGLGARRALGAEFGRKKALFAALCASGALSAAGGVGWLIEHGQAAVPAWPVGDLRVPAAAILAGGWFLAGPGRAAFACLYLPVAVFTVILWRQQVPGLHAGGYDLHVLLLACMVAVAQLAAYRAVLPGRRPLAVVAGVLTWAGVLAWAAAADAAPFRRALASAGLTASLPAVRSALVGGGIGAWAVGAAAWLAAKRRGRAKAPAESPECTEG